MADNVFKRMIEESSDEEKKNIMTALYNESNRKYDEIVVLDNEMRIIINRIEKILRYSVNIKKNEKNNQFM